MTEQRLGSAFVCWCGRYLNDGRAGERGVVGHGGVGVGQDDVALAHDTLGHGEAEDAVGDGDGHDGAAGHGNEGAVQGGGDGRGSGQGDGLARGDSAGGGEGKGGEGHDGQGRVGGRAGGDEGCGEGVDLVEVEWVVECGWEGRLGERGADVGAVARLDGQDRGGGRQVGLVHDGGGGAEVGGNTDTLEDGGQGDEGLGVRGRERVGALSHWGDIGGWKGICQSFPFGK